MFFRIPKRPKNNVSVPARAPIAPKKEWVKLLKKVSLPSRPEESEISVMAIATKSKIVNIKVHFPALVLGIK